MNRVEEILKRNTIDITLKDGGVYTCRKIDARIHMLAFGGESAIAGMLEGVNTEGMNHDELVSEVASRTSEQDIFDMTETILRECMVLPAWGEQTDPINDTVCTKDMGPEAFELFNELCKEAGLGEPLDFTASSKGQEDSN